MFPYSMMKRKSMHFITLPFPFFNPTKKKRHRIKRERVVMAAKKMHGVPFHLILLHSFLKICFPTPSILLSEDLLINLMLWSMNAVLNQVTQSVFKWSGYKKNCGAESLSLLNQVNSWKDCKILYNYFYHSSNFTGFKNYHWFMY